MPDWAMSLNRSHHPGAARQRLAFDPALESADVQRAVRPGATTFTLHLLAHVLRDGARQGCGFQVEVGKGLGLSNHIT